MTAPNRGPEVSGGPAVDELHTRLLTFVGRTSGSPRVAADAVNEPMIRHWCQAMGDWNPAYTDPDWARTGPFGQTVAPPAMLQSWTHHDRRCPTPEQSGNAEEELVAELADAGYTSVVATGCTLSIARYLTVGERVHYQATIRSISPRKSTALGEGYFITTEMRYTDDADELVGSVDFVTLRFRPRERGE
ncbi:MaoC family dehydratase N-terminal domain-containing protein [Dactylosporangium sp. NPDC000555]|uniref:MaoC family dehydratase n=1 Tax=Dactylosporangium sp. NPDC000555 TaxID=3154260 RepID=UPI003323AF0A